MCISNLRGFKWNKKFKKLFKSYKVILLRIYNSFYFLLNSYLCFFISLQNRDDSDPKFLSFSYFIAFNEVL